MSSNMFGSEETSLFQEANTFSEFHQFCQEEWLKSQPEVWNGYQKHRKLNI